MPKSETFNRKQVVENATDIFWNKGYHATSMQDLVDATGLNRSSIYNSFGDKFNLFFECLKSYQAGERTKVFQLMLKSSSPLESIKTFFMNGVEQTFSKQNLGCFIVNSTTELGKSTEQIDNFLKDNELSLRGMLEGVLEQARKDGELSHDADTEALATYLFSSFQGLRVTGILASDRDELEKIVNYTLSVLK